MDPGLFVSPDAAYASISDLRGIFAQGDADTQFKKRFA